jgi:galactokinase
MFLEKAKHDFFDIFQTKKQVLKNKFKKTMKNPGKSSVYFSPGRVNLIGEHIDYNGGLVMQFAISYGTFGVVSKRSDNQINLFSKNYAKDGIISYATDNFSKKEKPIWSTYIVGVVQILFKRNIVLPTGFDMWFYGNLPSGAGLSSSASVEMLTMYAINDLFDLKLSMIDMVKIAQEAENNFVGVKCGIMDQFVVGFGEKDKVVCLNTNTLEYEYAKLKFQDMKIVIINTNKLRSLLDSKYEERLDECKLSLKILQREGLDINHLCDISVEQLSKNLHVLNARLRKRVKHVVTEQNRVNKALTALREEDIITLGKLMNSSHVSLRDDYEVTGRELDELILAAWASGAYGARMTGAGFGGCAIAIVKYMDYPAFKRRVTKHYNRVIGYKPSFYIVTPSAGVRKI